MDCRRLLTLATSLTLGCLGCLHHQTAPNANPPDKTAASTRSTDPAQALANSPSETDHKSHKPKASTFVAVGDYRAANTHESGLSPAQIEAAQEDARKMYVKALELDPKYLPAYLALARLYESVGDHAHAVETYQGGLKKHPKEAAVWAELAMCHARAREWDANLACMRKAVELDPDNRQYNKTLGFCLARTGHYDEGFACLKKTMGEAQAHYDLARMLLHLEQDAEGKRHLELAVQADPRLRPAQELLAELEGRYEQPVSDDPAEPAVQGTAN
jgi:tetratricopeptide (TPR) repeat protein